MSLLLIAPIKIQVRCNRRFRMTFPDTYRSANIWVGSNLFRLSWFMYADFPYCWDGTYGVPFPLWCPGSWNGTCDVPIPLWRHGYWDGTYEVPFPFWLPDFLGFLYDSVSGWSCSAFTHCDLFIFLKYMLWFNIMF